MNVGEADRNLSLKALSVQMKQHEEKVSSRCQSHFQLAHIPFSPYRRSGSSAVSEQLSRAAYGDRRLVSRNNTKKNCRNIREGLKSVEEMHGGMNAALFLPTGLPAGLGCIQGQRTTIY